LKKFIKVYSTHHVLDGAAKAMCSYTILKFFREAKIGDNDVTASIQKNILEFNVAVDYLQLERSSE
jgi:hypothetical protein